MTIQQWKHHPKNPTEYSYVERRAEILEAIIERRYPGDFNYSQLGRRYDVSTNQISEDFDRLADYYEENLGTNRELVTGAVYRNAIKNLLDNEEYRKAAQTVGEWNEWIDQQHEVAELVDRIDTLEAFVEDIIDDGDRESSVGTDVKIDDTLE